MRIYGIYLTIFPMARQSWYTKRPIGPPYSTGLQDRNEKSEKENDDD